MDRFFLDGEEEEGVERLEERGSSIGEEGAGGQEEGGLGLGGQRAEEGAAGQEERGPGQQSAKQAEAGASSEAEKKSRPRIDLANARVKGGQAAPEISQPPEFPTLKVDPAKTRVKKGQVVPEISQAPNRPTSGSHPRTLTQQQMRLRTRQKQRETYAALETMTVS